MEKENCSGTIRKLSQTHTHVEVVSVERTAVITESKMCKKVLTSEDDSFNFTLLSACKVFLQLHQNPINSQLSAAC